MAKTNHRVNKDRESKMPESPAHQKRREEKRLESRLEEIFYDEGVEAEEYDMYERREKIGKRK